MIFIGRFEVYSGHKLVEILTKSELTNRFYLAVGLSTNRIKVDVKMLQKTKKKVAHESQASVSVMFLPHFGVFCDPLLNRTTATWNPFPLFNE